MRMMILMTLASHIHIFSMTICRCPGHTGLFGSLTPPYSREVAIAINLQVPQQINRENDHKFVQCHRHHHYHHHGRQAGRSMRCSQTLLHGKWEIRRIYRRALFGSFDALS